MTLENELTGLLQDHLSEIAPTLDHELQGLLDEIEPDESKFVLIEYDSQEFNQGFSATLWCMSAAGEAIGEGKPLLQQDPHPLPEEIEQLIEEIDEDDEDDYDGEDPWFVASQLFEALFVQRIAAISLPNHGLSLYIAHHDSYNKIDLISGEDINWDEIIERANEPEREG
jgi:hypothetical protein